MSSSIHSAGAGTLRCRLMTSSCVAAAALSVVPGFAHAADGDKWQGHAESVFRPGTNRIGGSLEAFIPLGQDEDSLFFLDARQGASDLVDIYGNWGLGVRQIFSPNLILGGYVYSDATLKDGNSFFATTLGVEAMTPNFDARFNFHVPISKAKTSSGSNSTTLSIIDHRLVEETLDTLLRDKPMWGFDTEVGVKLPVSLTAGDDLRLYAGAYHYWADDVRTVTGGRGTLEYSLNDVFGIDGSTLSLGGTLSYDNVDHAALTGEIRLRVPLQTVFGGEGERPVLSPLEQRMTARVRRDLDIRLGEEQVGGGGSVTRFAQDGTGTEYGYIYYADGNGTTGAGTAADPTSIDDAITNATAVGGTTTGGIVVLDGGAGTITTAGVTLQDDQTVVGAGGSIGVLLSNGSIVSFGFGGTSATVQGTGGGAVFTLANNNTLQDFSITDGGTGVSGSGIDGATISGLTVSSSTGNGMDFSDTTGDITIANSTIGGLTGSGNEVGTDGISATNVESLAVSGSTITGGAAGSAIDVDTGANNTELAIDTSTLATTGGVAVVDANGSTGAGTLTITSLSGNTVLGGNGEDGGIVVDTATFQASGGGDAAGGDTTIGTTTDRISGSGLVLNNVDGGIAFGNLNIANSGGAGDYGLFIQDAGSGFNFSTTGGSIDSVGGTAVKIDPVTTDVTLSSITSTNADGDAIILDRVSGAFNVVGQTTITNAGGWGIRIVNSDGDITFGDVDIDTPGTGGMYQSGNSGDITFGNVTIDTPGSVGVDFEDANTGQTVFGSLTINGLTGGTTGIDLTDGGTATTANVLFGSLNISGTGGTGIDMTGSTNSGNVGTTGTGTITGLDIGVDMTNAAITGLFQFGDGSNLDGDGAASTIDATTPLVVVGLSGASGTYNFNDVNLVGDTSGLISSQTVFYADANGTGTGATINDTGSIADAEASGADVIILVNSNGTVADTITVGGDGTLTLDNDQDLMSFATGDTISLAGSAPVNVLLYGVSTDIINPYSGLAPTLTTVTVGTDTVTLGDGNFISGVVLSNGGGAGGAAISGNGVAGVTISGTTIANSTGDGIVLTGASGAISLADVNVTGAAGTGVQLTNVTGTVAASNSTVSGSGGSGILIDGGSQNMTLGIDLSSSADTGLLIGNRTGGTVTYTGTIDETDGVDRGIDINSNTNASFVFQNTVDIVSDGANEGVLLSNTGGAVSFNGGLSVQTDEGFALYASGIELNIAGASNTLASSSAGGLILDTVSTSGGISLSSVSSGGIGSGINDNEGIYVSGLSGSGALTIASATLSDAYSTGVYLQDITTTGAFTIGSLTIDNAGSYGVRSVGGHTAEINLGSTAGGLSVDGGPLGLSFEGSHAAVNLGTGAGGLQLGATTAIGGDAVVFAANSTGTFAVGNAGVTSQIDVTSGSAAADGIGYLNSDANVTLTNVAISGAGGYGLNVSDDDGTGQITLAGTNTIDGTGLGGVSSTGANISLSGLTVGGTTAVGGAGVAVDDGGQSIVAGLTDVSVVDAAGAGIDIDGSGGGSITIDRFANNSVATAGGVGVSLDTVTFDADGGTAGGGDADFTGDTVNGGTLQVGQGGSVAGAGVSFANVSGDVSFGAVDVASVGNAFTVTGTGALNAGAGTGFQLATTSGAINSSTGSGVYFDPFTANVTLTSITSNGGQGLVLDAIGGSFTVTGDVTVNGATGNGIDISNSSATVQIQGTTTVTGPNGDGIALTDNSGTVTFNAVSISNPNGVSSGVGIDVEGTNAAITFGNVSITGLGDDDTGLDLSGATLTGALLVNSIAIQGVSSTATDVENSIGVNLTGVLGNQIVYLGSHATPASGPSASIVNLETGVLIDNTAAVQFAFGDGESTSDVASVISVVTGGYTIDAGSGTLGASTFDFSDVTFTGDPNFPSATSYIFVSATATNGTGDGSYANPYSVSDADAILTSTASFVFLDGVYDFATLNGGNAFTLSGDQTAQGLAFANEVTYGVNQPANIIGDFGSGLGGTITGSGSQEFTNSGNATVFDLQGNNRLSYVTVDASSLTGDAITASSHGGAVTIEEVEATNLAASSAMFSFTGLTGGVFVQDSQVTISQGTLFQISGGTASYTFDAGTIATTSAAGFLSVTGSATLLDISGTTGGSVTATGLSSQGTGSALVADDNDATIDFTGLSATNHTGANAIFDIDTGTGGSTGAITFDATSAFSTGNTATIFEIGAGARNIDADAVDITLTGAVREAIALTGQSGGAISFGAISYDGTGATGASVIAVSGQSGGTLTFGAVNIGSTTAFNNSGNTAVSLAGSGGTVTFADLDIVTAAGGGLSAGGITLDINGTSTISATGGTALSLSGTTIDAGGITFTSLASSGASGDGVSVQNATGGALSLGTIDIDGSGGAGVVLSGNAATVSIAGGTIDGTTGNGITITDTAASVTGVTFGGTTAIGGNAVAVSNTDATARTVTLTSLSSGATTAISGAGISASSTGAGTLTLSVQGANLASTGAALVTTDGGTAGQLVLDLGSSSANTFERGSSGATVSITGGAVNSTILSALGGLTVTGNGTGGGVLFDQVTFDASGTALSGTAVTASGAVQIGQDASNRVAGDGLRFDAPEGRLDLGDLDIYNDAGTGLYVDTKTNGTTFTLTNSVATSNVDTTNGTAMFLDPLSADLTFNTVSSTGASDTGVTFDGVTGVGTGSNAVTITTLNISGATLQSVLVQDSSGSFSLGNATINSATSIGVEINGGSADVSFGAGSSLTQTGAGAAVQVLGGHTGSLTYSGSINATNGTGLQFNNADGTSYAFNGAVTLNGGGAGIDIFNGSDAAFTFSNTNITTSTDAGLVIFNANVSALTFGGSITQTGTSSAINISSATGGIHNISADITANTDTADAITIASTGTFNFTGDLDLTTSSGSGFSMTGGTLSITGTNTSVSTSSGQILSLSGTTIAAGGVTFDTLTATGTVTSNAIVLNNVSGPGSISVTGTTSITDPGAAAVLVSGTLGADVTFADLNIALQSDNSIGIDLSGATINADITAGDFDLTSSSATGTTGIDLGGTTGTGTIQLGDTAVGGGDATIAGTVGNTGGPTTGVLFSSTTNVTFVFGDGESATDTGSSITAVTPVDDDGSGLPSGGSYNFLDATLTGDTSALSGASYYVVDTANSGGTGTFADPGTVAGAEAANVDVIVVIDTTVDGSSTTLDLGSGAFDLDQDQILVGLVAGESFDPTAYGLAVGAPASFQFSGSYSSAIAAPNTGTIDTVDATITSSGSATVNLNAAGGSVVDGIRATNTSSSSTSAVVRGAQINGSLQVNNSALTHSGSGHGVYLTHSAGTTFTTTFTIDNNTITTGTTLNDHAGVTIESSATSTSGVMSGTVSNNTISGGHYGIYIHQNSGFASQTTVDIDTNIISNVRNGIFVDQEGNGRADATITNNTVNSPLDVVSNGILFFVGNSTAPTICADVTGNTLASGSSGNSIYFDTYPSTSLILPGYAGGSTSEANIRTFLDGNNTATVNSADVFLDSGATASSGTCTLP